MAELTFEATPKDCPLLHDCDVCGARARRVVTVYPQHIQPSDICEECAKDILAAFSKDA